VTRLPCVIDAGMRTALLRRTPSRLIAITLLLDYSMACRCRDQGCADPMIRFVTIKNNEPAPAQDMASALLGIADVTVTEVEEEADGRLSVWAMVTRTCRLPWLRCYFGTRARVGGDEAEGCQVRRAGHRPLPGQAQAGMRGGEPPAGDVHRVGAAGPPRCQITRRLEHAGSEITGCGITPAESAQHNRMSWPSAHGAFAEQAEEILGEEIAQVPHLH
jgi:hypothetical protein